MKRKSKIITNRLLYLLIVFQLIGCEQDEIKQPAACMEVFNATTGNVLEEPYLAMINQSITVTSCNVAQLYAFYPGTDGKSWQGQTTKENEGLSSSTGSFTVTYAEPGEYPMTLIVTNRGEDFMEYKRDELTTTITISDNNADLVAFDIELSSGTVLNGIPQGNQFIFTIPEGIGLTNVIPRFQTGTDFSTVTLRGEQIESGVSRIDLNESATVIVTAYDGTQKSYEIIINIV